MAAFALIEVRRFGKLAVVRVLMAVSTLLELDFELGIFALVDVALTALHGEVLALERIIAGVVILGGEG